MIKKITLLTLLSAFTLIVSMPSVLTFIQKDISVNFLLDVTEDENKESETSKEKEVKIMDFKYLYNSILEAGNSNKNTFYLKGYMPIYLNLVSPPPEFS